VADYRYCDECRPGGEGIADRAFRALEQAHVETVMELTADRDRLRGEADKLREELRQAQFSNGQLEKVLAGCMAEREKDIAALKFMRGQRDSAEAEADAAAQVARARMEAIDQCIAALDGYPPGSSHRMILGSLKDDFSTAIRAVPVSEPGQAAEARCNRCGEREKARWVGKVHSWPYTRPQPGPTEPCMGTFRAVPAAGGGR
jgi:hypothetical protein